MSARLWGVPSVEATVPRQSVCAILGDLGGPVVVLAAPSGYGKTTAAAQFCRDAGRPVVWLGLSGGAISLSRVLASVTRLLCPEDATPTSEADLTREARNSLAAAAGIGQTLLVLDDVAGESSEALVGLMRAILEALAPFVSQVIATTRHVDQGALLGGHDLTVVDRRALCVTADEAIALSNQSGGSLDSVEAQELAASAGGHIALFRMLLTTREQVSDEGGFLEPGFAALALVDKLLKQRFSETERRVLKITALLKEATIQDIDVIAGEYASDALRRSTHLLPLLRWDEFAGSPATMRMHDLVADCIIHRMAEGGDGWDKVMLEGVLAALVQRSDWGRIRTILTALGNRQDVISFVERHGQTMLGSFAADELVRIVDLAGLQQAMGSPKFLLTWAQALYDLGDATESLAKAQAAQMLAAHSQDYETSGLALSHRLDVLSDQGRLQDALDEIERELESILPKVPAPVRCNLLLAAAHCWGGTSQFDRANRALERCEAEAEREPILCREAKERAARYAVHMALLRTGDWAFGASRIPELFDQSMSSLTLRETLQGNLAWCYAEVGRLTGAQSILDSITGRGNDLFLAGYGHIAGMALVSKGDFEGALAAFDRCAAAAQSIGARADYNGALLMKSTVLKCAGRPDEALEFAQRAFEGLTREDFYRYSDLAAVEVAASMLALGDCAVAERWLPESSENLYHEAAKLAVGAVALGRQTGSVPDLRSLGELRTFIRSGSINWRLAMYCRLFPELLGYLAKALGSDGVPLHLLRMVSDEGLEAALAAARPILSDAEWHILGERALGKEQFEEYLERAGKPICRVRLFGGLEVVADGRQVTEKDWKKRKARVLFAMLALNAGQDISRDVIFDHLWPDLTEEKAKNNFYVVWSTMKSALMGPNNDGPCPYIESRRGRCKVVKEAVRTDVDEVDSLLQRIRQSDAEGRTDESVTALQELMSLYRGDLLPGDLYDDWFSAPRERYRFEFIDMMLRGAELLMEKDDPYEALVFARRALMMDPFREDIYQVVLRCQILAGQRSAAIETFVQCKAQLAEELGLDPTAETQALYQQILAMEEKPRYDTYRLTDDDK